MSAGDPAPTPRASEPSGGEGAVRGGQFFRLLGGSVGSRGSDGGDDSGQFLAMSRADSGVSDLTFALELSGVSVKSCK